jgi:putative transposase
VTKCIEPRRPVLGPEPSQRIADALEWYARQGKIQIAAFVVMPDHWHLLFHTEEGQDVTTFMATACRWISRETRECLQRSGVAWQTGFHETLIRTTRQFQFVRQYIEDNPVRKLLVAKADEWQWSTVNERYRGVVPESWPVQFETE